MIKAVFFDIDNTLFSHTSKRVPASTETALRQLKEKGIKLFLATGRHMPEVKNLLTDMSFDGYITLNGQICLDAQENLLYDAPIRQPDARNMVDAFERYEFPAIIIERDRMYSNFKKESARQKITAPVPEIGTYTGETIYQFIVFGNEDTVDPLMERLPNCKMTRWNPYGVDIISKDGGKLVGVRHFLQHFRLEQDEIMAFGDGENDTDMLCYAGVGIAMGNAERIAKEQADYVTDDIDQDGIYKALKHYEML